MINRYYTKINFTSLLLIAFFIPVSKKAVPLLILIYGLNWLLLQNYKEKIQNLKKNYLKVLFLTSIYIIYLLSLCYSSNMDSGLFDMEVKLTLLLFPVILFSSPLPVKSDFNKILIAFVSGCFVAVLYCFIMATKLFIETRALSAFVYINFSVIFHPTYFSLYLNFSIIILLQFLFDNQKKQNKIFFFTLFLILLFSLSIILANSKAVILTLFLTLFLAGLYYGYKRGFLKTSLLITSAFLILVSFLIYKTPQLYLRIADSKRIIKNYINNENLKDYEGTSQRILIWQSSITIIKKHFLIGVGAGDVKDSLMEEYSKKGYKDIIAKNLNAHNQFLQTFIATGVVGFIILFSLFIFPLINSFKRKNFMFFSFLIIVMLNLLTESMLETQAGVIFFAFFNTYLFAYFNKKE